MSTNKQTTAYPCEDPSRKVNGVHTRMDNDSAGVCKDSMTVQIGVGGGWGGVVEPDGIVFQPCIDCLRDVFGKAELNAGIYRKLSQDVFPSVCSVSWCVMLLPCVLASLLE